jgi:hypothetical protein
MNDDHRPTDRRRRSHYPRNAPKIPTPHSDPTCAVQSGAGRPVLDRRGRRIDRFESIVRVCSSSTTHQNPRPYHIINQKEEQAGSTGKAGPSTGKPAAMFGFGRRGRDNGGGGGGGGGKQPRNEEDDLLKASGGGDGGWRKAIGLMDATADRFG